MSTFIHIHATTDRDILRPAVKLLVELFDLEANWGMNSTSDELIIKSWDDQQNHFNVKYHQESVSEGTATVSESKFQKNPESQSKNPPDLRPQ